MKEVGENCILRSFITCTPCQIYVIKMMKSRRMRWAWHVARMGKKRNMCRTLVGRPEGKGPLGRPRCRCLDNIKMDLREIDWCGMDWI
jgi:hypothetical protein